MLGPCTAMAKTAYIDINGGKDIGLTECVKPIFSLMDEDGPAKKSKRSNRTAPPGAEEPNKDTNSVPSKGQNFRWMEIRDKVKIKRMKIGELGTVSKPIT